MLLNLLGRADFTMRVAVPEVAKVDDLDTNQITFCQSICTLYSYSATFSNLHRCWLAVASPLAVASSILPTQQRKAS
jgi:hypothetical protein